MKKIIITFLLALGVVFGYAQDPYQTKQKISNPLTQAEANGALSSVGPMWSKMTDTIHAYAIPKYKGALVMRHADSLIYSNTGSYWRCVEQPFAVEYPLYVDYSDPAYPRGILKFAAGDLFNNKLLRTGGITLNSGVVTVAPDIVWTFNSQVKVQNIPSNFNISNATDLRVDIIYIDSLDNMQIKVGTEDAIKALEPEIPYNAIRVARVDIDGTTITVTPTPNYEPMGVLYGNRVTGIPQTFAADFSYDDQQAVLGVGNNRGIGTTSDLYLNAGRAKIRGRFNGMILNVGSGFTGQLDLSKFFVFSNKGTDYVQIGSTTLTRHYFKLLTNTILKIATVDSLPGNAPHVLAMSGDSLVKYQLPSGGGGSPVTASNGLTKVTNDIQLGGTLTSSPSITAGNNTLYMNGTGLSALSQVLNVFQTGQGYGIVSTALNGYSFGSFQTGTNSSGVKPGIALVREGAGGFATGIGTSLDYMIITNGFVDRMSNRLISTWTNFTDAGRTSQLQITGVSGGTDFNLVTFSGNGAIKFDQYGAGTKTGNPAYSLGVDGSGNVVETVAPKIYMALLTQSSTGAPTVQVLQNTTGLTITWTRIATGIYKGTYSVTNMQQNNEAVFMGSTVSGTGNQVKGYIADFGGQNHILIETFISPSTGYSDDLLLNTAIEIKIFP